MDRGKTEIKYFDVVSLYPYVLATGLFPCGHPTIRSNVERYDAPSKVPLLAIMKVKLLCPKNLEIPIIPVKKDGQLLFCTCVRCAEEKQENNEGRISCEHSEKEREFIVLTNSVELRYALKCGYVCKKVYHEMKYEQKSSTIFIDYIRAFLKIKESFFITGKKILIIFILGRSFKTNFSWRSFKKRICWPL